MQSASWWSSRVRGQLNRTVLESCCPIGLTCSLFELSKYIGQRLESAIRELSFAALRTGALDATALNLRLMVAWNPANRQARDSDFKCTEDEQSRFHGMQFRL